jgi:hypothetical protein
MPRLFSAILIIGSILGAGIAGAKVESTEVADFGLAEELGTGSAANPSAKASPPVTKMLLKLGSLKTDPEYARLTDTLESASRQALGELPGVRLLDAAEDADAAVAKRRPPVVLITGKLAELGQKDDGEEVLISAKVEYFVHRMPGESIAAIVSGVATARVAPIQMKKRRLRERLERSIILAAAESAAKRTPAALNAAAK